MCPRPVPGYTRPSAITCLLCKGTVQVAPKGTIPEHHPCCAELVYAVNRLRKVLATVGEGREPEECARIGAFLQGDVRGEFTSWGNKYANPASIAAAKRARGDRIRRGNGLFDLFDPRAE